jgi:glyoxylase-like metal-dependent hydrolase (beta-lactamase superfamily II)
VTPEEALERAAEAGIHRLAIPTPFQVGRVNTYLIEDSPLTLVDSGPNSGKSLDELERQLAGHGHSIDDLELVIVTHPHMDHFGLVDIVANHSGAEVAALDLSVPFLESYGENADRDDEYAATLMRRYGVPDEVIQTVRMVSGSFRSWGARLKVTRPLRDGETLELRDRKLEVLHRPGHSQSDTLFWDAERRILIAADHLIAHISSNALLSRRIDDPDERTKALVTYLDSLAKTREMPAEIVLSGHGQPITDHVALIDERLRFHRRRAEKLNRLIAEEPRTAFDLAHALWGNVAVTQAYLTLSEVVGHVDLLLEDGRVGEVERDGVVFYEAR